MADKAILVIDSDTETAQRIESALESQDYLVFIASTEEFGITMARKVNPALIFVSPTMPGGSGLEICSKIHGTEALEKVPIIVLSSFEGELDPRYRSEYGIVDALGKLFTEEELLSKTASAISLNAPETAPSPSESPAEQAEEEPLETGATTSLEKEEGPKELLKAEDVTFREDDATFTSRKALRRRRRQGSRYTILPIAAAIFVVLAAAGFVLFKIGLISKEEVKKPAMVKALPPAPQKPSEVAPQQKPEQTGSQATAVPPAAPPSPSPVRAAKPEPGPSKRPVYSVQVGAFRDEKNAEAVLKQFRDKGYDVFVQSIPKDKEMLHRILIGKFENRKEAWKMAAEISSKEKVKAVVTGD